MFERFSDRARQIVVIGQEEARELGHPFVGAEHLLLGAVRAGVPVALDKRAVRDAVVASLGDRRGPVEGQIPFTAGAVGALNQALVIALGRGERTIEPPHVLLALCEDEDVMGVLLRAGFPAERVRAELA